MTTFTYQPIIYYEPIVYPTGYQPVYQKYYFPAQIIPQQTQNFNNFQQLFALSDQLSQIASRTAELTNEYLKPITPAVDNTKSYSEVEDNSLYSFKSKHLVSSSRPRIAAHARQVIRKSRGIEEFDTTERGSFSRAMSKCPLYNGMGELARSRFREIWQKGYFTLRNGNTARQNTIVLDNKPLLLADIRKQGHYLVIEYSHGRRNKNIDDIAYKNHYNKYYHLDRRGC